MRKHDGSTITYLYDNLNRVIRKTVPERAGLTAAQTRDVYYDYYHALGLMTKARFDGLDGEGVTNYYDEFGQPTTTLLAMNGSARYVSYYYDDAGGLWRLTHPDGANFYHSYDALGRMTSVLESWTPGNDDYIVRYTYKPTGPRATAVRGAGTAGFTTSANYDLLNRPDLITNDLPGTANDVSFSFAYNAASQIVSRTISNDSYTFNRAVNVSRPYSVNGLNQYTAVSGQAYGYDPNGNLISDGSATFTYDVENRLVSASNGASLVYDPLGRLFQTSGGTAGTTQFLYDGDKMIAEYDGAGNLLKRYVHGPGADEPVAVYEGSALGLAARRYMLQDHQGSIAALINADGTPYKVNGYDAWGFPNLGDQGRFGYTGQAWIPELGMNYYKARIYSPALGRFMQTDPVGYKDQVNLYAYVGNDPMNRSDPTGLAIYGPDDKDQRKLVERLINARAAGGGFRYAFSGKNHELHRVREAGSRGLTGSRLGSSHYYSNRVDAAIKSNQDINIRVQQTMTDDKGNVVDIDRRYGGGVTVPEEGGNASVYISGNGVRGAPEGQKTMDLGPAEILAHELLGHAIPRTVGTDTGNAIKNENKRRLEAGLPRRPDDPDHVEWP